MTKEQDKQEASNQEWQDRMLELSKEEESDKEFIRKLNDEFVDYHS